MDGSPNKMKETTTRGDHLEHMDAESSGSSPTQVHVLLGPLGETF